MRLIAQANDKTLKPTVSHKANIQPSPGNVCFWHKADIPIELNHVRFWCVDYADRQPSTSGGILISRAVIQRLSSTVPQNWPL
jgi:hypothetical protein